MKHTRPSRLLAAVALAAAAIPAMAQAPGTPRGAYDPYSQGARSTDKFDPYSQGATLLRGPTCARARGPAFDHAGAAWRAWHDHAACPGSIHGWRTLGKPRPGRRIGKPNPFLDGA